jgi:hypothetical protein
MGENNFVTTNLDFGYNRTIATTTTYIKTMKLNDLANNYACISKVGI